MPMQLLDRVKDIHWAILFVAETGLVWPNCGRQPTCLDTSGD